MNDKKPKNFYKSKRYINKKKPTKSYNHKDDQSNENVYQSLDPIAMSNLLNVHNDYVNFNIPFYGWKLFFHDEDYESGSDTVQKIQTAENFINKHQQLLTLLTLENLENGIVFVIDMCELCNDTNFLTEWSDFKKDLHENPLHTLNCFKLAIHQQILRTLARENLSSINIINTLSTVRLKILNHEPIICLQDLKANFYGKLVSIRGCVIRVGHVKHLAQWIVFACRKCGLQKIMKQPLGVYTVPRKCNVCGVSKFRAMLDSPLVKSISFQTIKIQELTNNDQNSKGSMPRMVDIELMDDLVNICMPGDDVTLTGIIKGTNHAKIRNKNSFSLYMEAITIVNNKQRLTNKNVMNNEMSIKDYLAIKEVYNTPNIFPLLVHSLCPSIYGHEIVKAGLMLSLFGGNVEHSELRENIHILVVGDPGLGKSQMLQACARNAAKGVYVCGNATTSSGLTITLTKENKSNNFSLEPGALVLADRGCCCIDEFDKMYKQHAVLLESMEQQSVSIAKSGIICSLPTRTSILAAANPISGRFNRSKTITQNLKMSAPLLSRFDLIFLLLDEPNTHIDDLLCKHVLSIHANSSTSRSTQSSTQQQTNVPSTVKLPLKDRLRLSVVENVNVIPQSILRKYIAYARQYVKPKLTEETAALLQKYYLELRQKNNKFSGFSICNRQLEAMIRLTEARAKLELRTEAVETDALDVIEIFQHTFDNENVNWQSLGTKNTTSGKITEFIKLLKRETDSNNSKIFTMKRLQEIALDKKFLIDDFPRFIMKLNDNGILLKIGKNTFKFIS
ncbi:PREDICTED: DNA helicase MCM8 [Eufriesea mexicana]|uniref:DNA helicase MCM8 n=1 Tax=Eufriesea mexicana TaxID=516756 RepID=UPI00083BE59E|nr:PREDICTED: DNA helicase MCM8 [Eufriesea mexicana]